MQIVISGHHYHVSNATRAHIKAAMSRFERFYNPVIDCHVTARKEERAFRVDIIVNVHRQTLKASDEGMKLFPAIDGAAKKMVRQLKKLHDKRRKPRRAVVSKPKIEA